MENAYLLLVLAAVFGLFMAWGIGANDVANAMATSVGSKALTLRRAVLIAVVFEASGAYLAGGEVTSTIRKGIVDTQLLQGSPELLVYGMLSALLAAGVWLLIASRFGLPVSTTHSIVGAIVGFALVGIGTDAVHWQKVASIVASWVVSPLMAGCISFLLIRSIQRFILNTPDPIVQARRYTPIYIFLTGLVVALVTLFKGLKHVGLTLSITQCYLFSMLFGLLLAVIGAVAVRRVQLDVTADRDHQFANVERIFAVMMIVSACSMAFAHGSNDVANAVGPVAAVVSVVTSDGDIAQKSPLPPWVLLLGAAGIVAGLMMYGHKVIATVGGRITDLTPSRGFACELAASTTVVIASGTGLPISTTHTLVGAILGVGMARGIGALNLRVIGTIFMSWIVTLPAGAALAVIFFFLFKAVL